VVGHGEQPAVRRKLRPTTGHIALQHLLGRQLADLLPHPDIHEPPAYLLALWERPAYNMGGHPVADRVRGQRPDRQGPAVGREQALKGGPGSVRITWAASKSQSWRYGASFARPPAASAMASVRPSGARASRPLGAKASKPSASRRTQCSRPAAVSQTWMHWSRP